MPTTINTIEDLIQLLDENPQWVQALRARLLTRELIELPESFARFVRETNLRFDRIDTDLQAVKSDVEVLKRDVEILKSDVQVLKDDVQIIKSDVQVLKSDVEVLKDDVQVLKSDVQTVKNDIKSIRDDMVPLKGAHTRNAALREADLIAEDMGFVRSRVLSRNDIRTLARSRDTSGISKDALRSFRRADLIMEATKLQGDLCYVAVEVSFTVNGRDTTRALRNADFLTSFTDRTAYAAVAGARLDERVRSSVESGDVFWYQLDSQSLEAE